MAANRKQTTGKLTTMGFFAITIVMVMDLYEYSVFATSGLQLVFFLLAGGVLWFLPVALCSAEMATVDGWQEGGIFAWVKNTLGERFGFAAIFFQWFQVTVGFITMLYFILSAITSLFGWQQVEQEPLLKFIGIMILFWGITVSQFGGTKRTELIGRIGLIAGIIIPAVVLAALSGAYIAGGNQLQIQFSTDAFIPDFSQPATLVVFVSFILSYAGIEASASYINELENPKKEYPRTLVLVVIAAVILNTIGGLSIAAIVPQSDLSMSGGIIQALQALFTHFNSGLGWMANLVALLIAVGVIGEVSSWVVGPARGMYVAAQQGFLPPVFKKVNKNGVPVPLVLVQGVIVTIWGAVLTFGGGGNNLSFLAAISLTIAIYLVAYLLLFAGYFVLLFKKGDLKRTYHVPGGKPGKFIIAASGFIVSIFALIISFVPPSSIESGQTGAYEAILAIGFAVVLVLPFIIYARRDKSAIHKKPRHFLSHEVNRFVDPIARGEHHIDPDESDIIVRKATKKETP